MCLYVSPPLDDGMSYQVHAAPGLDATNGFFSYAYNTTTDYTDPQREVPNGLYAEVANSQKQHPSESLVGWDWKSDKPVYADSLLPAWKPYEGVQYVKSPVVNSLPDYATLATLEGHLYGKGKCRWITKCTAPLEGGTDLVGTKCSATSGVHKRYGYCYQSSTNTLECGALTEINTRFGYTATLEAIRQGSTAEYYGAGPDRGPSALKATSASCPRGIAVTTSGAHDVTRLLVGGCMIPADNNYEALAEVHLPFYCAAPADYFKGCMFPGAVNFDGTAKQSGVCYYNLMGCTDSSALNYNMEANMDDGSCEPTKLGCTIHAETYWGVDIDTPAFNSSFVGQPWRSVGKVAWGQYKNVNNYDPLANSMAGCVLAVEGCMDSTALNFDHDANVNHNTWCVPVVKGCMMPATTDPNLNYLNSGNRIHYRDGLAINYEATATVDTGVTGCIAQRYGCMSSSAVNYDLHATVNYGCYEYLEGCLNSYALNYNCSGRDNDAGVANYQSCTLTSTYDRRETVAASVHAKEACNWIVAPPSPPPMPPSPPGPPGSSTLFKVKIQVQLGVELAVCAAGKVGFAAKFASNAGGAVESAAADIACTSGSSILTVTSTYGSAADQNTAKTSLAAALQTPALATALLGVNVLSTPTVEGQVVVTGGVPGYVPEEDNMGVIIGVIAGVLVGVGLLVAAAVVMKKRAASKVAA